MIIEMNWELHQAFEQPHTICFIGSEFHLTLDSVRQKQFCFNQVSWLWQPTYSSFSTRTVGFPALMLKLCAVLERNLSHSNTKVILIASAYLFEVVISSEKGTMPVTTNSFL